MKQAKQYNFLTQQQQRFQLHVDNVSNETNLPSAHDFYRCAWQALKKEYRKANLSLVLLDEEEARAYNHQYGGKDYATNVLSFALNEGEVWFNQDSNILSGDLIICPQVVVTEAAEQNKTPTAHFAHLTVHGVLHLMGYDHINDDEAETMEALEISVLNQLGYANPYLQDEI